MKEKNIKSNTLKILKNKTIHKDFKSVGIRVSKLWNGANYLCRQNYIQGLTVPGYKKLCSIVPMLYPQDYKALPSDIAQEV